MSDELTTILTDAGGTSLSPYLTARGITTVALLARAAPTEEALVADLVTPFIEGWQASDGTSFKAEATEAVLVRAALTVAWEDARLARARALAPVPTAPVPAASSQQSADRPERAPIHLLPGQWTALVDAYNSKYAPAIRAFPEEMLMGAESIIARMVYELKTSRHFTPLKLGEIVAKRAFTADGAPNRVALAQADSPTGLRLAVDGTFTQVTPQHTPTSAMQILDALEAIRWAYILCAYGEEASATALEDFFKSRVRRATGDYGLQEVKYLWLSASWRIALAMRKGQSFDEAVDAMIGDIPWQAEQAAGFRQEYPEQAARPNRSRSRRRRSRERTTRARSRSPGKHGKGGNKGKSKAQPKQRVDTSRWLTEVDGSEICRNWNLSLCSRTKCARAHICAICRGPHRATDKAHH